MLRTPHGNHWFARWIGSCIGCFRVLGLRRHARGRQAASLTHCQFNTRTVRLVGTGARFAVRLALTALLALTNYNHNGGRWGFMQGGHTS
jgi:hypothetical protein